MNKINIKILLIILLIVGFNSLRGQENQSVSRKEKVTLFTDRNLYISGEEILFSASVKSNDGENSRILYCELVTPEGIQLIGGKYLIINKLSSGQLLIPSDLITGNYYFRAYTKCMRNCESAAYSYSLVKIVNPYRKEVQSNSGNNVNEEPELIKNDSSIKISTWKNNYLRGDTINISVDLLNLPIKFENLCLTIVPEFSFDKEILKIPEDSPKTKDIIHTEINGIKIIGTVLDEQSGNVIKGIRVNLSIIGEGRDFIPTRTDSSGRFYFAIPDYYGNRDIFLCTEKAAGTTPRILVDNDFCSLPVKIPARKFELSYNEHQSAFKMAVNHQIRSFFNSDTLLNIPNPNRQADPVFYGEPDETLFIDNYVQLPTLEEYFNGLPTPVKVRKRHGTKNFIVLGTQTALSYYDPLVLVDFVAIDDPEKVLSINPMLIEKIEFITELYLRGDQTYGGIISFITRKGDFAGINLPSSGIFINYNFLESSSKVILKESLTNYPDIRNTLLWEPQLFPDDKGFLNVSTVAPETPGKYMIIVRGVGISGKLFRQVNNFEVVK